MFEADFANMMERQDLQPRALGKDRITTNHRFHRTEEMEMDFKHPAKTTAQYSQTSPRLESSRSQATRKTHTWRRTLDIELHKTRISWGELKAKAMGRFRLRDVLKALCSTRSDEDKWKWMEWVTL